MNDKINCPKKTYLEKLRMPWPGWRTLDADKVMRARIAKEHTALTRPTSRGGMVPDSLFALSDGRTLRCETWLMVLRAHTRGRLALKQLAPDKKVPKVITQPIGDVVRPTLTERKRPTPIEMELALRAQGDLLEALMQACPLFFADMLVEPEPARESKKRAAEHYVMR